MRFTITLILLLTALPAMADTLTVSVNRDNGDTNITEPLVLSPANIGAATYTILPYGDTRRADYYCTATDCGPAFQTALDAIKASGKGGNIKVLEGTYPFTTSVVATDADSVRIEGVTPVGMWSGGGSIFLRKANISMFNFTKVVDDPNACDISGIHFKDYGTYAAPLLKYVNAHNMGQFRNYFDGISQAIYAERAWDFWTTENNFRNCGTGDTKDTACITMYNGSIDQSSGWMIYGNRFETRPGTSIYSDASGASGGSADGANTINVSFNKFEGQDGSAYPAVHGVFWASRFIGNSVFKGDTAKPPFWIVHSGSAYSGANVVQSNTIHAHKDYGISIAGDGNNIGGNAFFTQDTPAAHVRITSGSGNAVGLNTRSDSIPLLSDAGTGTVAVTTLVDNTAYNSTSWDGDATHAPSKDAMRDKIESLAAQISAAGGGTVVNVSSADGNATVTNPTVSPVITVVAAPKLATARTINGVSFDGTANVGQDLQATASPQFAALAAKIPASTNIIGNSTFADATGWTSSAGNALPYNNWSVSGGTLLHTAGATQSVAALAVTATDKTIYKVVFTVTGMTTGTVQAGFNASGGGAAVSANGTYTQYFTAAGTGYFNFVPSSTFDGAVDNVYVYPVPPMLSVGDYLTVTSDGQNLGIGTTAPAAPIEVLGNGLPGLMYVTTYSGGDNTNQTPSVVGRGARGTATTPIQSKTGDTLMLMGGRGHDGTSFSTFSKGDIGIYAAENWTSSAQGTYLAFRTTTAGGTTRSEKLRINSGGMMTEGLDDKTASFTVANSTSRITLGSGTATATLKKDLPAGTTSVLVTVAGAAASGVSFAAESGGSISWGDAGTPTFTNNKTADVVCTSENAAATSTAAWRCVKGGNF